MAARLQGMAQLMCRAPGEPGVTAQWVDDELWPQGWRMSVGPAASPEPAPAAGAGSRRRAQALHPALQAFPAPDRAGCQQAQAWADWWESGGAWKDGRAACAPHAGPVGQAHGVSDPLRGAVDQAKSQSTGQSMSHLMGHLMGHPMDHPMSHPVNASMSHPAGQPVRHPLGESTRQVVGHSSGHSSGYSAGHSAGQAGAHLPGLPAAPVRRAPLVIATSSGAGD